MPEVRQAPLINPEGTFSTHDIASSTISSASASDDQESIFSKASSDSRVDDKQVIKCIFLFICFVCLFIHFFFSYFSKFSIINEVIFYLFSHRHNRKFLLL